MEVIGNRYNGEKVTGRYDGVGESSTYERICRFVDIHDP
jgi:hypothetical protein